jgi:hypothetical protein
MLEHAQNQTLRMITGAVNTTPIDAMTFITGNKSIQELIKENAVLLHEKLLRIPDQYWKTYENKPRNLKTQNGFIQKVREIQTKFKIKSKPQPLHQRRKPTDAEQVECYLHLQQSIIKGDRNRNTQAPDLGNNEHQLPSRLVVAHFYRWLSNRRVRKRWRWHSL